MSKTGGNWRQSITGEWVAKIWSMCFMENQVEVLYPGLDERYMDRI